MEKIPSEAAGEAISYPLEEYKGNTPF